MENNGIILSGTGGLYTVLLEDKKLLRCKARGLFRIKGVSPLAGDNVTIRYTSGEEKGYFIEKILPRKTELSRPPVANIDTVFITLSVSSPAPNLFYTDKLICSAANSGITPVIVITKTDISEDTASELEKIYSPAFDVFPVSAENGSGILSLLDFIKEKTRICAFAGASGVGKSSLINSLFPEFSQKTGSLSARADRGKHTTRTVSLLPTNLGIFVADTPGFTMLDLDGQVISDFDNLPYMFPEFENYFGKCKYRGCTHIKEEGCAVIDAVNHGLIAHSRHESYVTLFLQGKNFSKKG